MHCTAVLSGHFRFMLIKKKKRMKIVWFFFSLANVFEVIGKGNLNASGGDTLGHKVR